MHNNNFMNIKKVIKTDINETFIDVIVELTIVLFIN